MRTLPPSWTSAIGSAFAADLEWHAGWEDATRGCDYVLHVASPFPPAQPKDPNELIIPARDGALRVLGAGLESGVRSKTTNESTT